MDRKEIAAKQARLDSTERKTVDDVKEASRLHYTRWKGHIRTAQRTRGETNQAKYWTPRETHHEKLTSLDAKLTKKIDEQINSNYGLLDVVTERICFFCSQERYVYNMWRGFRF